MTDDLGNALYKRNKTYLPKTYFPNVYGSGSGNAGFGPNSGLLSPENNPAYQAAINPGPYQGPRNVSGDGSSGSGLVKTRGGLTMVNSPNGGQIGVTAGQLQRYLDKGYTVNTPPRTPLQNFDLTQAYNTGYGAPTPTTQQGPGGPYQVSGGVMKPIQTSLFPNIFATPAATAIGNFAGGNIQSAFSGMRNVINQANSFFSGNRPQPQPPYGGGYAAGPRRYFDY